MGLSPATTCNSVSCGSDVGCFCTFLLIFPRDGYHWMGSLAYLVGMFVQSPSPPIYVTFKVTSHPRLIPFCLEQFWG